MCMHTGDMVPIRSLLAAPCLTQVHACQSFLGGIFAHVVCSIDQLHCHDTWLRGSHVCCLQLHACIVQADDSSSSNRIRSLQVPCYRVTLGSRPMMSMAKFLTTSWFRWESRESHGRVTVPRPGQKRPISTTCIVCVVTHRPCFILKRSSSLGATATNILFVRCSRETESRAKRSWKAVGAAC